MEQVAHCSTHSPMLRGLLQQLRNPAGNQSRDFLQDYRDFEREEQGPQNEQFAAANLFC